MPQKKWFECIAADIVMLYMAFIITFSNMWGLILKEWQGSSARTIRMIIIGLTILVLSTFVIGAGNYIQTFE